MQLHPFAHHHSHPHGHAQRSSTRRQFISSLFAASVLTPWALGQMRSFADIAESFRQRSEEAESKGLAEPFKGITTNGAILPDLFRIAPGGASTESVRNAAVRFISSLNDLQLVRTMFPIDAVQWRKWMNQNYYTRQGVSFREMTGPQRTAALDLMRASLSPKGFELTRNIMRLNETLAELTNDHLVISEWAYYITIMGKPSATEPWGWQFQCPHAIINCFVLGDQLVMTPLFLGSEPTRADAGKYEGLEVLQKEQNDGLSMVQALPSLKQRQAVLKFFQDRSN